jgi:toxin secretion/phage lysis holin
MAIDIITGIMCGWRGHRVTSRSLGAGLREKVAIMLGVFFCHVLELVGLPHAVTLIAVVGFLATEGVSVTENLGYLGVPLPAGLKARLGALKPKDEAVTPATIEDLARIIAKVEETSATEPETTDAEG